MYRSQSGDHMVQRALMVSSSGWHRVSVIWFGLVLSLETRRGGAGPFFHPRRVRGSWSIFCGGQTFRREPR